MQTFLPYPDFEASLRSLDYRRLGKQRLEASQIYNILTGVPNKNGKSSNAWKNHVAVRMWKGYENALASYYNACLKEWERRGYVNNMKPITITGSIVMPVWIGDERLHSSHRSNLLRKNYEFYSQYHWTDNPEASYFWPVPLMSKR